MNIEEFNRSSEYSKEDTLRHADHNYMRERLIKGGVAFTLILIMSLLGGCPIYNVWEQGLMGEAELARAEHNRKILINEAKSKSESAVHWAKAEVERAKGAAKANEIVAESLGGSEGYLRWLFIEKLDEIKNGQIIYLPTEAGMPILEANRFNVKESDSE